MAKLNLSAIVAVLILVCSACGGVGERDGDGVEALRAELDSITSEAAGTVGIAVITSDGDTLTVNECPGYPLMSVFKLHEAIAVAHELDRRGHDFDSVITISRRHLVTDTWSPMLDDIPPGDVRLSVAELMGYMLEVSDNNASNLLFDSIVGVRATDSLIRTMQLPGVFALHHREHDMQRDHALAYQNHSSPLACAALVNRVAGDLPVSAVKRDSIVKWLGQCVSAPDRMSAAMCELPAGSRLYHRTGSGYTDADGRIAAVNDVGLAVLPDGRRIALAVLVRDYAGMQSEADSVLAAVSRCVFRHLAPRD